MGWLVGFRVVRSLRGAGAGWWWDDGLHVGLRGVLSGVRRLGGGGVSSRSVRGKSTEGGWVRGG